MEIQLLLHPCALLPLGVGRIRVRWRKLCLGPEARQPGSQALVWSGLPWGTDVFVSAALQS